MFQNPTEELKSTQVLIAVGKYHEHEPSAYLMEIMFR